MMPPFFVTVPHSGEKIPPTATWLQNLPVPKLMRDVDRYVDRLYLPIIEELKIPHVIAQWHRYVVDLNRTEEEYDAAAVIGAPQPKGTFPKGLHWSVTTLNETLIHEPMPQSLHQEFVEKYYRPFHQEVENLFQSFQSKNIYHLDLHSMPSVGTALHPDPGERRADIVISDQKGKSADPKFVDLVIKAYEGVGFEVKKNWPYIGGGITKKYGHPERGHHTVQVELNRALYMDEESKNPKEVEFASTQLRLCRALESIFISLPND